MDRLVDTAAARLACRVMGDEAAPPLVMLHALAQDGSAWDGPARRLSARYRVYAPDLRGHGQSSR